MPRPAYISWCYHLLSRLFTCLSCLLSCGARLESPGYATTLTLLLVALEQSRLQWRKVLGKCQGSQAQPQLLIYFDVHDDEL